MELTHLSLFSGIGGLDLAAEWAGFHTVGQCEWADYPTRVLEKHWPDVPRWRDIRTLTKESFCERTGLRTVDIISGGFPCQPFSKAGQRRGKGDDRYLWPEMLRVIDELRPAWVIGENVANILNLALDDVLSDLESKGYTARAFMVPARGVGAPHQRYRFAIVAHADGDGRGGAGPAPAEGRDIHQVIASMPESGLPGGGGYWKSEPGMDRMVDGLPNWMDRVRCLGNAVCPPQFFPEMSMGAILERVDYEMGKVMDNILDPNTKATAKRKISVTLELIPSADRRTITVQSTAKCSLTPTDPVTTSLYITNAPSTGELLVAEMVPQVPGQLALDGEEQDHPKILKFKRQA